MSGNTFTSTGTDFTCRDRYFNYGSYLRSRGYDKEICNLIIAIEQGQFPIGPIYPGNCSKRITTTIKGNVDIVPCEVTDNTSLSNLSGQLSVTGGFIGAGNIDPSGASLLAFHTKQKDLVFNLIQESVLLDLFINKPIVIIQIGLELKIIYSLEDMIQQEHRTVAQMFTLEEVYLLMVVQWN